MNEKSTPQLLWEGRFHHSDRLVVEELWAPSQFSGLTGKSSVACTGNCELAPVQNAYQVPAYIPNCRMMNCPSQRTTAFCGSNKFKKMKFKPSIRLFHREGMYWLGKPEGNPGIYNLFLISSNFIIISKKRPLPWGEGGYLILAARLVELQDYSCSCNGSTSARPAT